MTDTTVRFFNSAMTGAPSLTGLSGSLISVLDACLQNGFGQIALDSVVVSNHVATATYSLGHGFAMLGTTGPVIRIAGATPAGLNGDWRVTVTSTTQFTFSASGISDQTASGSITAKRAPLGFTQHHDGYIATYQSNDMASTRCYLRVDDNTDGQWGYLRGYETMSDVNNGTGLFPSSGEFYAYKSSAASGTARAWTLIGDSRSFFLFEQSDGTNWPGSVFFGDLVNYKSVDAYHCALVGHYAKVAANNALVTLQSADLDGHTLARAYTQLGTAIKFSKVSHKLMSYLGNITSPALVYPDAVTNGFLAAPVEVLENGGINPRGVWPGLYCPLHHYTASGLTQGTVIDGVAGLTGDRSVWIQATHSDSHYRAALDLTGPWR